MIIKFNTHTRFMGAPARPGDVIEVDEATGLRWSEAGIADILEEIKEEKEVDLKSLTAKQLYKICIEKGLEVEEKQPKDVYLKALSE